MKKFLLIPLAGALLLGAVSCNKEIQSDGLGDLVVTLDFPDASTKATVARTDAEKTINKMSLLVFDGNGMLANPIHDVTTAEIGAGKATIEKVRTGSKTVVGICNQRGTYETAIAGVTNLSDLQAIQYGLAINARTNLVAVGSGTSNVTTAGGAATVTMGLRVGRICLKTVKNHLPASYGAMILKRAFLCDVQTMGGTGTAAPDTEAFVNKSGTNDDGSNHIIGSGSYVISNEVIRDLTFQSLSDENVANASQKDFTSPGVLFYCGRNLRTAPNNGFNLTTPTATTLMVVASIGGTEYYYPVPVTTGVEAGYSYDLTLDIVGLGNTVDTAYNKIEKGTMTVTIGVADWTAGGNVDETI